MSTGAISAGDSGTAPYGAIGASRDRGSDGRFLPGNRAALVTGARSAQFWMAADAARQDLARAVIADAGHTEADAPRVLAIVADGLAQATLVRDSAFVRIVEDGGPITLGGRARRAFTVWLAACVRVERYARLVGLRRVPRPAPTLAEYLASRPSPAEPAREGAS